MAQLLPSLFSKFELTEAEQEAGSVLTFPQKCVIQNMLSDYAEEKIRLAIDSKDFEAYLQREAELAGNIRILQFLLDQSMIVEKEIYERTLIQGQQQRGEGHE